MKQISLVMTLLGKDRPGLVESIAQVVAEHGANWVESQMAHLAGQFAGILRVEVAENGADALTDALRKLDDRSLELVIHSNAIQPNSAESEPTRVPLVRLELVGQDRLGIVREITHVLAAAGVNVEEFTTERTTAPTTGQLLFQATALLRIPPNVSQPELRHKLEQLAADLMVEISLEESLS